MVSGAPDQPDIIAMMSYLLHELRVFAEEPTTNRDFNDRSLSASFWLSSKRSLSFAGLQQTRSGTRRAR